MRPHAGRRTYAYGDPALAPTVLSDSSVDRRPNEVWRFSRSTSAGGAEFVSARRGPPHGADLGDEKDRVAARSSKTYAPSSAAQRSVRAV